ncbi:MAG: arsenate reductase family protein [Succinivibrio sp.]|nr:arsenate reductase family protein [Succinivibrio sp.]
MLKVYCYSRCSTCKKALQWLDAHQLAYECLDLKTEHPDVQTLKQLKLKAGVELKKMFNTSGMLYRELKLASRLKDLPEDEQYSLLASDGMLVKRPLLIAEDRVLIGFKEDEWQSLLK